MADKLRDAQDRVSETARNVRNVTNDYVRENPWKIIAIVAVAACVTGWLVNAARD